VFTVLWRRVAGLNKGCVVENGERGLEGLK